MSASHRYRVALGAAVVGVAIPVLAVASATGQSRSQRGSGERLAATATLVNPQGARIGVVELFNERRGKVRVEASVRGLTPGFHGFHVHEKGECRSPSADAMGMTGPFLSAGGHYRRGSETHGAHQGDMPTLYVMRDGRAVVEFVLDSFRVNELIAGDGSAVIVHANRDNQANIPDRYTHPADATGTTGPDAETLRTGDSGGRVACGAVRRPRR
jgi:superoxide dismutase, Cu-Zn family